MLRKTLLISFFLLIISSCLYSQDILDEKITLNVENQSIEEIVLYIQDNYAINFSYSSTIIDLSPEVSITCSKERLETVLYQIFDETEITFTVVSGLVILRKKPQNLNSVKISGKIYDANTNQPLEFAGLQILNTAIGTITNEKGEFFFSVKKSQLSDSLLISALGYERQKVQLAIFSDNQDTVIYLKSITFLIAEVDVNAKDYKTVTIGNKKKISFGSIYIDTHGQQTALYVENEGNTKGTILAVNYYLSNKGNTKAPFRVRLYNADTSGCPGMDLLPDVLIAKPKFSGGWFTVNLSHYNIPVPENGFFVAIEGIYPVDKKDFDYEEYPNSISYGQQLGYSRKKGSNTWHFSISHTWFQMEEDNYNVMISVDIQKHKISKKND